MALYRALKIRSSTAPQSRRLSGTALGIQHIQQCRRGSVSCVVRSGLTDSGPGKMQPCDSSPTGQGLPSWYIERQKQRFGTRIVQQQVGVLQERVQANAERDRVRHLVQAQNSQFDLGIFREEAKRRFYGHDTGERNVGMRSHVRALYRHEARSERLGRCSLQLETRIGAGDYLSLYVRKASVEFDAASTHHARTRLGGPIVYRSISSAEALEVRCDDRVLQTIPRDYVERASQEYYQRSNQGVDPVPCAELSGQNLSAFQRQSRAISRLDSSAAVLPVNHRSSLDVLAYREKAKERHERWLANEKGRSDETRGFIQGATECKYEMDLVSKGDEEAVRKYYSSRPDELYKRKQSRRFAQYRRIRIEQERLENNTVKSAEAGMRKRRALEMDRLRTYEEDHGGFRHYRYSNDNTAFAYCSTITQNHARRGDMIEKYSQEAGKEVSSVDSFQRAQLLAEQLPMFHTRVMNRFR
ncbi:hypothetical protein FVE85_0269 [Porphyridium purpureum]|uniref:Uncharacterized protein n=1 Tax=Porphyridium purpureum TaxID=35688 RepID=A0A5J4YZV0_PORPP|nr:hypothetical protein FVE85_0269 [Porphyridium purpureum]|eukprot:POR6171..scf208_2